MKVKSFKSGNKAFDWKIPMEWDVHDAYIVKPNGVKDTYFDRDISDDIIKLNGKNKSRKLN